MWTLQVAPVGAAVLWSLVMPSGTRYDNGKAKDRGDALRQARASLREDRQSSVPVYVVEAL